MTTASTNHVCIELHMAQDARSLIERAAAQTGQTLADFAISAALDKAHNLLGEPDRTELTERDHEAFLTMLDAVDAQPSATLLAAAEEYKRRMS
jgi:uncharacterized protein (DUF1778 family)